MEFVVAFTFVAIWFLTALIAFGAGKNRRSAVEQTG